MLATLNTNLTKYPIHNRYISMCMNMTNFPIQIFSIQRVTTRKRNRDIDQGLMTEDDKDGHSTKLVKKDSRVASPEAPDDEDIKDYQELQQRVSLDLEILNDSMDEEDSRMPYISFLQKKEMPENLKHRAKIQRNLWQYQIIEDSKGQPNYTRRKENIIPSIGAYPRSKVFIFFRIYIVSHIKITSLEEDWPTKPLLKVIGGHI